MARETRLNLIPNSAADLRPTRIRRPDGDLIYVWEQGGVLYYAREKNDVFQTLPSTGDIFTALNPGFHSYMDIKGNTIYLTWELNNQLFARWWDADTDPTFINVPRLVHDSYFVSDRAGNKSIPRDVQYGPFAYLLDPILSFEITKPSTGINQLFQSRLFAASAIEESDIRRDPNTEQGVLVQINLPNGGAQYSKTKAYRYVAGYNFYLFRPEQGGFIRLNDEPVQDPELFLSKNPEGGLYGYTWVLKEGNHPWQWKESPLENFFLYPGNKIYGHVTDVERRKAGGETLSRPQTIQFSAFSLRPEDSVGFIDAESVFIEQMERPFKLTDDSTPMGNADTFSIISSDFQVIQL